uniref:uncharacterized protein n=1 Tax=Myxine glutinosa TaxID=7769 RepID=UPI00358F514C
MLTLTSRVSIPSEPRGFVSPPLSSARMAGVDDVDATSRFLKEWEEEEKGDLKIVEYEEQHQEEFEVVLEDDIDGNELHHHKQHRRRRREESIPMYYDPYLPTGWHRKVKRRMTGRSAGKYDVYIFSPTGKQFRSRNELAAFFEISGEEYLKVDEFNFSVSGKAKASTTPRLSPQLNIVRKSGRTPHKRVRYSPPMNESPSVKKRPCSSQQGNAMEMLAGKGRIALNEQVLDQVGYQHEGQMSQQPRYEEDDVLGRLVISSVYSEREEEQKCNVEQENTDVTEWYHQCSSHEENGRKEEQVLKMKFSMKRQHGADGKCDFDKEPDPKQLREADIVIDLEADDVVDCHSGEVNPAGESSSYILQEPRAHIF